LSYAQNETILQLYQAQISIRAMPGFSDFSKILNMQMEKRKEKMNQDIKNKAVNGDENALISWISLEFGNFDDILNDINSSKISIEHKEIELIKKALDKYRGRRKKAANELGISERTLYRKIKQYDLEEMIIPPPTSLASSETHTAAQKQAAHIKLSLDFEALTEENLRLKRNISGLNHLIEQTKHANVENISKASQQGFKAGHSTVIKEIKKLWTSHEFAAELMYGEKHV
jgi:DNA-binding protein Fis